MRKNLLLSFTFIIASVFCSLHAQQESVSATSGKEFLVSYLEGGGDAPELKVIVEKTCHITAIYNQNNTYWNGWNNALVSPGIYTYTVLKSNVVNTSAGKSLKTLRITSTENITVYAHSGASGFGLEATAVLPIPTWSTEYYLATGASTNFSRLTYTVAANENGTVVTLHNGNTATLDKNEVYTYRHSSGMADLTGKKVSATKPVAVYSGATQALGPGHNYNYCATNTPVGLAGGGGAENHVYEQLWSVDKWGRDFFVFPAPGPNNYDWGGMIVIVAQANNTEVTVSGALLPNISLSYTLNAQVKQTICSRMMGLCRITANKPIMVFNLHPIAAITYIAPTEQRVSRVIISPFVSHRNDIELHALQMLIPAAHWDQTVIRENGVVVPHSSYYQVTTSTNFPNWYIVERKISPADDIKIEVFCPGGLLAYMYGYDGKGLLPDAYGFLAGAGAYELQAYFTVRTRTTPYDDTYYTITNDSTHVFMPTDNITINRTIEKPFTQVKWLINGVQYTGIMENTSSTRTLTIPASALNLYENNISMSVRYTGALSDSVYTGKVWYFNINNKDRTICSGTTFNATPVNGVDGIVPSNTNYTWTVTPSSSSTNVSGQSAQITGQTTISQTLTNHTNSQKTVTYTVTPKSGGVQGAPFTVTVKVDPKPSITAKTATICSGDTYTLAGVAGDIIPSGTTFTWSAPSNAFISGITGGTNAAVFSQTLTTNSSTPQILEYEITPSISSCFGQAFKVTLTVNPLPAIPVAYDDRMIVFACGAKTANVLANDPNTAGGAITITKNGKFGTAELPGGPHIKYQLNQTADCATHGGKRDTVRYKVCSVGGYCPVVDNCAEANLVISILRRPSIILVDSCSRRPYLSLNYQYHAAVYKWFVSPDGTTWTEVPGSPHLKLYVTESAWYKVEITFSGETTETKKAHFVVNKKSRLQGNLWWYTSSISD